MLQLVSRPATLPVDGAVRPCGTAPTAVPDRPAVAAEPWRLGQPRYELRVTSEVDLRPVLVWSRHRSRRLAELSLRLEQAHLQLEPARLVLVDRRTGAEVAPSR
jgi:hypothetical protein